MLDHLVSDEFDEFEVSYNFVLLMRLAVHDLVALVAVERRLAGHNLLCVDSWLFVASRPVCSVGQTKFYNCFVFRNDVCEPRHPTLVV